jgi:uncharacterized membrane protein
MAHVTFNMTKKNVGNVERWITTIAGLALTAYGIKNRKKRKKRALLTAAGGGLLLRGISGHSFLYDAFGINRYRRTQNPVVSVPHGEGMKIEHTISINRSPEHLFRFWRNLENLPIVMKHLQSVTVLDDTHSHWVAKAPAGQIVEWDAVIHNEIPNKLIAWRSVDGSEIDHAGSVEFNENSTGGTDLQIVLNYRPPAGKVGAIVAKIMGEEPSLQIEEDLKDFKSMIEATQTQSPRRGRKLQTSTSET